MKYAIIKPDHLGDLILSAAAIRAIAAAHPSTVLFVSSKNLSLAGYLFPKIEVRPIDLIHLSKSGGCSRIPDLSKFDAVAFLRSDGVLTEAWATLRTRGFILPQDTHSLHQTVIDYTVASLLAGPYDIDAAFYGDRAQRVIAKAVAPPRRVGLSIGSGFYANTWPINRWIETAYALLQCTDGVTILCGPAEREKAEYILARLGRPDAADLLIGGQDVGSFIEAVDRLDLVIASDGGTAHLCSLVTPIISVFGPSPFRRYAPFGRLNRLLTRELSCSPCCQYTRELVNGCLTTECMTLITVQHLERALALQLAPNTTARPLLPQDGVNLYLGVSHIAREQRLSCFDRDARLFAVSNGLPARPEEADSGILVGLQERRLALIEALNRLKCAPPERYAISVRRVAQRFAQLREVNRDARTSLARDEEGHL